MPELNSRPPKQEKMATLESMPTEIIEAILSYLAFRTIEKVAQTYSHPLTEIAICYIGPLLKARRDSRIPKDYWLNVPAESLERLPQLGPDSSPFEWKRLDKLVIRVAAFFSFPRGPVGPSQNIDSVIDQLD
ncbi:unnamed protein product [Clonostachys rosea]|uniref:F-box domain-containing protein n=1 Tax=Bionectria ochroleuca TaxID=29856 RepID=A0ABY6UKR1_BIOOC|nr:unnamed protein product [Clonostachys rosea]